MDTTSDTKNPWIAQWQHVRDLVKLTSQVAMKFAADLKKETKDIGTLSDEEILSKYSVWQKQAMEDPAAVPFDDDKEKTVKAKAEPKSKVKAEAKVKPEVKPEVKPKVKAEAKAEAKAKAEPKAEAKAKPEPKAEAKPEPQEPLTIEQAEKELMIRKAIATTEQGIHKEALAQSEKATADATKAAGVAAKAAAEAAKATAEATKAEAKAKSLQAATELAAKAVSISEARVLEQSALIDTMRTEVTTEAPDTEGEPLHERRKKIPKHIKTLVWNKYIGADIATADCLSCRSGKISNRSFHCGHVLAESRGGNMTINNLRPICAECNLSMMTKSMNEFTKEFFGWTV